MCSNQFSDGWTDNNLSSRQTSMGTHPNIVACIDSGIQTLKSERWEGLIVMEYCERSLVDIMNTYVQS
jgi:hypothetical protein